MSAIWIEKLRAEVSAPARDELLLRDLRELLSLTAANSPRFNRLRDDVEEQMRALAAVAFPPERC